MLYPPNGRYRRALVDPAGDHCIFVTVSAAVGQFGAGFVRSHPSAYATLNLLATYARGEAVDPLLAEEKILAAVEMASPGRSAPGMVAVRDAVEDARVVLATRYGEALSVSDVARLVSLSPFHLARLFRRQTGTTMHAYRDQVRLRIGLSRLGDHRCDLAQLALELGYSSHSHFTTSFRRAFGVTPSEMMPARTGLREALRRLTEGSARS